MILKDHLRSLSLTWMGEHLDEELAEAARKNRTHQELIERLLAGELELRRARAVERRLKAAHIPVAKTLAGFDWAWPKKINRDQIRHLFTLRFMEEKANAIFIGGTGLGKSHLASALAHEACQQNRHVLFAPAVTIINTLAAAQATNTLGRAINRYHTPELLVIDELGYLPVDRTGADLLFQVLGGRYERGSTIITTNRVYKDWAKTFANDATLTAAVLDRVCHHSETIVIEGRSYRMKGRIEE